MSQQDHHIHQMDGFVEESADGIPLRMGNSLQGSGNGFVERNVPPPDQRPPALSYASFPGPGREITHNPLMEPYQLGDRLMERSLNPRPAGPPTMTKQASMPEYSYSERPNTDSSSQRAQSSHSLGAVPTSGHPFLRPEVTSEDSLASPRTDRLPSFRQLSKIADGGTEGNDSRVTGLSNLSTYPGQIVTQTATTSHPHFSQPTQASPSSSFMHLGHPSPTNARSDGVDIYAHSHSPATYSGPGSFPQPCRRTNGSGRPPAFTASSSGDTTASLQSHQSSEAGGYSTNQSTPAESTPSSLDSTPRPPLAGPLRSNSSTSIPSGFSCDYPGCNAPPFQTQYLLNSHANVHSSNRPHYCPVKGCPRSEGGKGFKRKNEMIRHGLVHDSPGYVCPFCPLREHKYPRPDNLQRHVRVHHVDKDKDDPLLREVLAQRPEGGGRGRRRRVGPA